MYRSKLADAVKAKRGKVSLREISQESGISPATLCRIEQGKTCDLDTFLLVCAWLQVDPGSFLANITARDESAEDPLRKLRSLLHEALQVAVFIGDEMENTKI